MQLQIGWQCLKFFGKRLSQIRWISKKDFIVLFPFIFLLHLFFKNQAFNINQNDFYIEENNHNKNNDKRFSTSYLITFQSWSSD